ncbi:MAG: DUF3822 family protein [Winogradskyella sp.]|uniref:DUF3822 family protein n=1 Tax=Winogradskyella sp. TaxID=1883156 RepID=UPI001828C999|nr:DUF3822 family protein [Winogradskyella sp.]
MTKNNIKELSIQVNLNGLSFCILNRTNNTISFLKSISFDHRLTPHNVLNQLKSELSSNPVFSDEFNDVIIIHQNELSTLVPQKLYSENHKADYLKFNSKILRTDFIATDEIAINNSVNIYVPYVNVNNFIFETFGAFVYKHASTLLIDTLMQGIDSKDTTKVAVNVNETSIDVIVLSDTQLKLVNSFSYTTKEDFIYYILFVFEQLTLNVETDEVVLLGQVDKDNELYQILYTYVRHITFLDPEYKYKFSDEVNKNKLHNHYLILNSF